MKTTTTLKHLLDIRLYALATLLTLLAEWIGIAKFSIGIGTLVLLPLLYAFLLTLLANPYIIAPMERIIPAKVCRWATYAVMVSVMPFIAKFGFGIGPKMSEILAAGPALLLQEIGNVATVVLALPVAVLLFGMGREVVGATHSIAREPNIALIADKYGMKSPEGIGVMGVYVMGTLFGAIYFSLLASVIASWQIFDIRALAMACGIGSGSMMGACSAGLSEVVPSKAGDIAAFAATSNLLTYATGLFVSVFIALPLANLMYRWLSPLRRHKHHDAATDISAPIAERPLTFAQFALMLIPMIIIVLLANWVGTKTNPLTALPGAIVIYVCCLLGILIRRLIPLNIPAIAWISVVGTVFSLPQFPYSAEMLAWVNKIGNLQMLTPVLAFAGFAISNMEVALFKRAGLKIAVVALLTFTGTFLGSAIIADLLL